MTAEALVLVGHGSHLDPDSARPIYAHADRIRATGRYDEVRTAFWKEEPSLREVLRTVASDAVVVVPVLMSDGYFAREVVPRELRLDAEDRDAATSVAYADPVGTHDAMTDVVLERARRARTATGDEGERDVGLAVVGHGTERSERSAWSTAYHAARVREEGRFDEVRALFLDEPPHVGDVTDHFEAEAVVVVPLFVADGYHTTEDVPEELGLASDDGYRTEAVVDGTRLWYAGAVGTEPRLAEVVRERAAEAEAEIESEDEGEREQFDRDTVARTVDPDAGAREAFLRWLERNEANRWGELVVRSLADGYELRHRADRTAARESLERYDEPTAVRDLVRFDDEGRYRPLAGARSLPTGWVATGLEGDGLVRALEFVYPASIQNWHRERAQRLDVSHYEATAGRQTGRYADVDELDGDALDCAATAVCGDCVKRRVWDASEDRAIDRARGDGRIPCREPCSFFVAAAREFVRVERGESERDAAEGTARAGAFDDPANRYRRRYLEQRRETSGREQTQERPCTRERYTS